ncbi:hypothetical protein SRABI27_00125 [Pedobacter sp. Bi27]|uniref:hypothetical protein n=1 Tax=Pedobacter sp. Bi27 TaxID=2822351 RepID=UPI001DC71EE9|nr:hypothetical protein [Pedobacter sp. Bi27]CAH0134730.1 hypothetical protein SRABI27_00125 [Pedobacter sp. Bi27]
MENKDKKPQQPIIIQSPQVIYGPITIADPIVFSTNTLIMCDMIIFRGNPLPLPEFRFQLDSATLRRSEYYSKRYGREFLNVPDDYFLLKGTIDTSRSGVYPVSARFNPSYPDNGTREILGNFICDAVVIVADSQQEAFKLYSEVLNMRRTADQVKQTGRVKMLSLTTATMQGVLGFSAMYTSMLTDAFQRLINQGFDSTASRQNLGLPQGHITRQELFVWMRSQDEKREFREKTVAIFLAMLPSLEEQCDKQIASPAHKHFVDLLREHIRQNRISAALDAIEDYNNWIKEDLKTNPGRLPLLNDYFKLGGTRIPDRFLEEALAGIPARQIKANVLAASVVAAGVELGVLINAIRISAYLKNLLPFSAPLNGINIRAIGLIGGPIAIGLTLFTAIFSAALEKIVHDGSYSNQLWRVYEQAQQQVRLKEMIKKESTGNIFIANLLQLMAIPSPGLLNMPSTNLLREVHRPIH